MIESSLQSGSNVFVVLPAKRQQRWLDLAYRWGRRHWPGERIHHPAAFNAMLKVPEYQKRKVLYRELRRLNAKSVTKITEIDNALTGDTTWIITNVTPRTLW